MDNIKAQMELKLIAAQLSDWCKHREGIIFRPSLCSQERVLRFQTPLLLEIFPNVDAQTGVWKSGCFMMYEIYNAVDYFKITCSVSLMGLKKKQREKCLKLLQSCGVTKEVKPGLYFLKKWDYPEATKNLSKIMEAMQDFLEFEMLYFETELVKWKDDQAYLIKSFPKMNQVTILREELPSEMLVEGGMKEVLTNRYERNPIARKKCIAAHGSACSICGFDFGTVYGPEFAGKIEVHHKLPLYMIKQDYVVDPVKDLIPVCANCHMILHSKPGGFYTVDEVRKMRGNVVCS